MAGKNTDGMTRKGQKGKDLLPIRQIPAGFAADIQAFIQQKHDHGSSYMYVIDHRLYLVPKHNLYVCCIGLCK